MTAQASEIFLYKGVNFQMQSEPLSEYLRNKSISFHRINTGCSRGYIGTWEIKFPLLYLIKIEGNINNKNVGLDYLFPDQNVVFANWFKGEISIPIGNIIKYNHFGHSTVYDKVIVLTIENGLIKMQRLKNNSTGSVEKINFENILDQIFNSKLNSSTLYELIELFNQALKASSGLKYKEYRKSKIRSSNKLYTRIDISDWEITQKEVLFKCILKGINIYHHSLSDQKSIPVEGFNSVMNAINGQDFVYTNSKAIKWFPRTIKDMLRLQKVEFEDLLPLKNSTHYSHGYTDYDLNWLAGASGTDDPETMNDVFWNLD